VPEGPGYIYWDFLHVMRRRFHNLKISDVGLVARADEAEAREAAALEKMKAMELELATAQADLMHLKTANRTGNQLSKERLNSSEFRA
jgi:hypothetical protein